MRILWAAHVNHHSSERYNLSTALRQSWTTPVTGAAFYWPLAFLGFAVASARERSVAAARRLLRYSVAYLPLLLALMAADKVAS